MTQMFIDDPVATASAPYHPTHDEVVAARTTLLKCSPELTLPYNDSEAPRVIPVEMLTRIEKKVLKRR